MLWWISFADDIGSRGVCITTGDTLEAAVARATEIGCNPGGQVMGIPVPPHGEDEVIGLGIDRLITPDELRAAGCVKRGEAKNAGYDVDAIDRSNAVEVICESCNPDQAISRDEYRKKWDAIDWPRGFKMCGRRVLRYSGGGLREIDFSKNSPPRAANRAGAFTASHVSDPDYIAEQERTNRSRSRALHLLERPSASSNTEPK